MADFPTGHLPPHMVISTVSFECVGLEYAILLRALPAGATNWPQARRIMYVPMLLQAPFALVFTKADKNKPQATVKNVDLFMQTLQQSWEEPPVFFISSALTREGQNEILNYINELNKVRN